MSNYINNKVNMCTYILDFCEPVTSLPSCEVLGKMTCYGWGFQFAACMQPSGVFCAAHISLLQKLCRFV
jgi:hypothetical protein